MDPDAGERVADAVAVRLAPAGWTRRAVGRGAFSTHVVRPLGPDLLVLVGLTTMPTVGRRRSPRVAVSTGVGVDVAMDLAPVLAVPVRAVVASGLDPDGPPPPPPVVVEDVDDAAREIAARAEAAFSAAAERFEGVPAAEPVVPAPLGRSVGHAVVLAATGRVDEAYTLLLDASLDARDDRSRRQVTRVLRQLSRWDRAGRPTPPPFEATLARLPPVPPAPAFRWAAVRDTAHRRRDALADVARHADGRTVGELAAMLDVANTRHGVATAPAALHAQATRLHRSGGSARSFLGAVRDTTTVVGRAHAAFDEWRDTAPPPAWRRLPETAASHARSGGGHTLAALDDVGRELLAAHVSATDGFRLVDVWFTVEPGSDEVRVHVGATDVGRLEADAATRYRPDIAAAVDVYDEHVCASGLAFHAGAGDVRLQLQLPSD